MDAAACVAAMDATLADAYAELITTLGGQEVHTEVRLWRGQVLIDWEADDAAGGCLLRPALVTRLLALHAQVSAEADELRLRASGNIVAGLSAQHKQLVAQLGGAGHVEMRAALHFQDGRYTGGEERYAVIERGRRVDVLTLRVAVSSTRVAT